MNRNKTVGGSGPLQFDWGQGTLTGSTSGVVYGGTGSVSRDFTVWHDEPWFQKGTTTPNVHNDHKEQDINVKVTLNADCSVKCVNISLSHVPKKGVHPTILGDGP